MNMVMFVLVAAVNLGSATQEGATLPIEREEDWPAGSAMQVGLAHNKRTEVLEAEMLLLGAELKRLIGEDKEPDSRLVEALDTEQAEWLKYRDASRELVGSSTGAGGVWPSTYGAECRVVLSTRRVSRLQRCTSDIKGQKPGGRQSDIAKCIGLDQVLNPE